MMGRKSSSDQRHLLAVQEHRYLQEVLGHLDLPGKTKERKRERDMIIFHESAFHFTLSPRGPLLPVMPGAPAAP